MFTGIVQGMGRVTDRKEQDGLLTLSVDLGAHADALTQGASVSIQGVCLTVSEWHDSVAVFDVIPETLQCTTLGELRIGDNVNIERSARIGDEIGGHLVSGHVVCTAPVTSCVENHGETIVRMRVTPEIAPYLFPKGFIALNGCSLTLVDVAPTEFSVHLIPETLSRTTFGVLKEGDQVNVEVDAMTRAVVDTVTRMNT